MVHSPESRLRIDVVPFDQETKRVLPGLFTRAWAEHIRRGEQLPLSSAYFEWHYQDNPDGNALLAVAGSGKSVVGALAAVPRRFRWQDGRELTGWQIGDFMVDATRQRQGIGAGLLNAVTEQAHLQEGGNFIYTFPNPRSLPLFIRCGYRTVGEVPTLIGPTAGCLLAVSLGGLWSCLRTSRIESGPVGTIPTGELDRFLASAPDSGPRVDCSYYNWRYYRRPDAGNYVQIGAYSEDGLEGMAIVRPYRGGGKAVSVVVDLRAHKGWWRVLVKASAGFARERSLNLVFFNGSAPGLARRLLACGLIRLPRFINPRPVLLLGGPRASAELLGLLGRAEFVTADWQGF